MFPEIAAYSFGICILIVVLFQLALIAGMPWGSLAMGGRFPGKLPTAARVAAGVQSVLLLILAFFVFVRAGLLSPDYAALSKWLIWLTVLISTLSLIMNLITPSKYERLIWAPVAFIMVVSSLIVAIS